MGAGESDIDDDSSFGLTDEEYADMGWSPERVAEYRARRKKQEREWKEATERTMTQEYGPPKVRQRKRKKFIADLVKEYSEPFIRRLLVELDKVDAKDEKHLGSRPLQGVDLMNTPLHEIIQPYEFFSYCLHIQKLSDDVLEVSGGCASGLCGRGSRLKIKRVGKGDFRILTRSVWIA